MSKKEHRVPLHASLSFVPGVLLALCGVLPAQGNFVNYEEPQIKPVAVASVGSFDYVLACNTPDNSVEVYRAEWTLSAPIARVPVGLSPVTVKWDPTTGHFYSCNFLGDSITRVRLDLVPATGSTPETVRAVLERTERVGDEPTDIAFDPNANTAVVTLHSSGTVKRILKSDLSAVTAPLLLAAFAPGYVTTTPGLLAPYIPDPINPPIPLWLVKQARRLEILSDNRSYVLNTMGGEQRTNSLYDLGLFAIVPTPGGGTAFHTVSGIGSTNLGLAVNAAQDRMFVVSQVAKNVGPMGVDQVRQQVTGFVQTWLKVVALPTNGTAPVVAPEQIGGAGTKPLYQSIDLNRDYSSTTHNPIGVSQRIAQVTDVLLVPDPTPGNPSRIVLAAFGSEKVAILTPDASQASGYARTLVGIPPLPSSSYSAVGPRGLAWSNVASQPGSGTTGLVFVMNRLDNSLAVLNPFNGSVTRRSLAFDPTPPNIRTGRTFLYTAATTSGNQMVSCSSCHIDGRTDALRWRLGDLHAGSGILPHLIDGIDETLLPISGSTRLFPIDKPETVTQTLQGLLTYHLEPDAMQFLATNAPYHWRGDKPGFVDFNEAFVNLQGMTSITGSPSGSAAKGISDPLMNSYASFINTIHHPPNPEQPLDRTFGGAEGNPRLANDFPTANGALLGRKIFHILPIIFGRTCVNCHSLPEGSSNTLTIFSQVSQAQSSTGTTPGPVNHPFESAALRNVVARELLLPDGFSSSGATPFWPLNGNSGLHHGGTGSVPGTNSWSLNDNIHRTFGPIGPLSLGQAEGLTAFVRQFDTGTAPAIGYAWTMNMGAALGDLRFDLVLGQAQQANVGVAVFLRTGVVERGFWYDAHANIFREESGAATMTEDQLVLALTSSTDTLIVQATPTGSERRLASLSGLGTPLAGPAPSSLLLLPMVPDTAYVGVTNFVDGIDPSLIALQPVSMVSQFVLADAVATTLPQGFYGVPPRPRHEPPRRLRIAGNDIRNGAKLSLEAVSAPGALVWFDLVATDQTYHGLTVWETAEELDGLQTMALLCGGHAAPGVFAVLTGNMAGATSLNPASNNSYRIQVLNDNATLGASGFAPLKIADVR